jgi:hypothetical protein
VCGVAQSGREGFRAARVVETREYKGYCVLEAAAGQLGVRYQAVHEHRAADSGVFTLRRFRVDSGRPVVVDEGGPAPI